MAITYGLRLNPTVVSVTVSLALLLGAAAALAVWRPWVDDAPLAPPPVIAAPPAPSPLPLPPPPIAPALAPSDVAEVRLHGTFGNAAVVSIGSEAQRRVGIGRQLLPGIVLESTAADHIIVARGDTRLRIPLATFDGIGGAATVITNDKPVPPVKAQNKIPTLSRAAFAGDNSRRQTLAFQLGLVQEKQGETLLGYRVRRAASMPFFARAGLRDGDIVVAINGGGLHGEEKVMELADELAQSKRVTISYLRDGKPHETQVDFTD